MDISATRCCSRQARGGQGVLILSAQICCTQVFSGETAKAAPPSPTSDTVQRLLLRYHTGVINRMAPGSKSYAGPKRLRKRNKRLGWVLAAAAAPGRPACSEARGEPSFASATESRFGQELRFAVVIKHSETLRVWEVPRRVTLPCNVPAICHPKRKISLKDNNYSRFKFFFIFTGAYLFTNSGYTADWRESRVLQACFFNLNNFFQGSSCNAEMSGWDTWAKAIGLALPLHCSTCLKLFSWKTR